MDRPWACLGPAWLDTLLLAVNVRLYGGDGEAILTGADVDPGVLTDVLVGFCGFFLDAARQPAMPNRPTVRAFQQAQGDALLPWVRARISQVGT